MSDFSAFAELERRSWSDAIRASGYVELFAAAPDQAIDHLLDAAGALAEARRVLRSDGKFAITVWCGPESSPCFAAVYHAIKTHGDPDVSAPPGPDFHQFARPDMAVKLLSAAGF